MGTVQVDRIIDRHGRERASLIAILQDIQDEFNWVCEDHLRHVASELGLPMTQVYGVATFYRALSLVPRGDSIIKVCMGTACHVRGGERVRERIEESLNITDGETTDDMRFTFESVRCIGCCSLGPVVKINEDIYGRITAGEIAETLENYE